MNSEAYTLTLKLLATLLNRTFSMVIISIDILLLLFYSLSEANGLILTVKFVFALALVPMLN